MYKYLLFFYCCCFAFFTQAQNLLLNGDFEEYWNCPDNWAQLNRCKSVFNPCRISTPDYFNTCSNYATYFAYNMQPFHGQGFVAIVIGGAGINDSTGILAKYREYVQIKLSHTLKANEHYNFSFFLQLQFIPYFNCLSTDQIAVKFVSEQKIYDKYLWEEMNADWENPQGNFFNNSREWQKIEGSFIASGGEEWMIIGNFYNKFNFPFYILDSSETCISNGDEIYVFIDNVEIYETLTLPNVFTPNGDGTNDVWQVSKIVDLGYIISEIKIYNRWGTMVFEAGKEFTGWDGNCNGQPCSEGVYFATALFEINNSIKKTSGYITLLR